MNNAETVQNAEVTETAKIETPVETVTLQELSDAIVAERTDLLVRPTDSTSYRILGTVEKTEINWRKGLIYQVLCFSKGYILEAQLYSVKKGAHLAEFSDRFRKLATDEIQCLPKGLAVRLKIKLPAALGKAGMVAKAVEFINRVEPEFNAVRELLKDEDFMSKKELKALEKKAEAAPAPVPETAATEPAVETPAPQVVAKAAKKNAKRK